MVQHHGHFIAGAWTGQDTGPVSSVISPVTEECIAEVAEGTPADIDAAVCAAYGQLHGGPWGRLSGAQRAALLHTVLLEESDPGA